MLPFCCLWKGRCIFFNDSCNELPQQPVHIYYLTVLKSEVWNSHAGPKTIFLQNLEVLWPFLVFRQRLHALEYPPTLLHVLEYSPALPRALEYPLHFYMPWSIPCISTCTGVSPYITLTSASAVTPHTHLSCVRVIETLVIMSGPSRLSRLILSQDLIYPYLWSLLCCARKHEK